MSIPVASVRKAGSDPMQVRGARTFTARPGMINEGAVTIRLDDSSQTCWVL